MDKQTDNRQAESISGRFCKLLKPVRDRAGRSHFDEQPIVLRELNNLDRLMYLVQFADGATTFLFPDEVVLQ